MGSLLTIGVDVGGTKVEAALVDANGRVLAMRRYPTGPAQRPAGVFRDIVACIQETCAPSAGEPVAGVGVGIAGQVDPATGIVRQAPNLGWKNVSLASELAVALQLPVVVMNDVQAATWGEWLHGAGQGVKDLVCLFVGTGIGAGIVSGGQMLTGCTGSGGELGHITLALDGPRCRCGNRGCLEAFAGGWAIGRRAQIAVARDPTAGKALLALAGGDRRLLTAAHVAEAAHNGDALAQRLVAQTGEALAAGVAAIVNGLNPCLVVLGGGVIEGLPELVGYVERGIRQRALAAAVERLRIARAALGRYAGVVGAAAVARRRLGGDHERA
jgi:glucokinase